MEKIIITVPHSYPEGPSGPETISDDDHPFDFAARVAATVLYGVLIEEHDSEINILYSDSSRSDCDLNRKRCRYTPFRKAVRKLLQTRDPKYTILLDIHSFPRDHANLDLFIIDSSGYADGKSMMYNIPIDTFELVTHLALEGVSALALPHDDKCDIISEAKHYGIRALLIEYNEDLGDRTLEKIAFAISEWLTGELLKVHHSLI